MSGRNRPAVLAVPGCVPGPAPVPANCDLRRHPWMPLDVQRLLNSETWLNCSADVKVAAVQLWCEAWHQIPAGSVPNSMAVLAKLSGAGPGWAAIAADVLDGWTLCDDGRLYHPVVAEKAAAAWQSGASQRSRTEAARAAKARKAAEGRANREKGNTAQVIEKGRGVTSVTDLSQTSDRPETEKDGAEQAAGSPTPVMDQAVEIKGNQAAGADSPPVGAPEDQTKNAHEMGSAQVIEIIVPPSVTEPESVCDRPVTDLSQHPRKEKEIGEKKEYRAFGTRASVEPRLPLVMDKRPSDPFDAWYALYPKKVAPNLARRAYRAAIRSGVTPETLLEALKRFRWPEERKFIPNPSSWLNGGRWMDEATEPENGWDRVREYLTETDTDVPE